MYTRESWQWTHIVVPKLDPCYVCTVPTRFAQPDFMVPLHPGACTAEMWRRYDASVDEKVAEAMGMPVVSDTESWWQHARRRFLQAYRGQ